MNDSGPPGVGRQAGNLFGEVSGYVAVIVAYVLAVSGRSPGPIPQTTAIITVLVTTIVVWVWRTNRIMRREVRAADAALVHPAAAKPDPHVRVNRLLEPFLGPGDPPYAMSLVRRRAELAFLTILTIAATAWSASRVSAAIPEFTGLRGSAAAAFTCLPAVNARGPRVVIADFEEASPQYASLIENRLFDALTEDLDGSRTICRLRQAVGTRQEARTLGQQTQAVLVIWGRSDVVFDVHLELANSRSNAWDVPGRNLPPLPSDELADFEFAVREPDRLSFLTDIVLSQVLYLDNKTASARQLLGEALERAEAQDLGQNNARDLGEAYLLLGYMVDPYANPTQADLQQALAAYSRSLELNPDLHAAALNRGKAYEALGELDLAIADYDTLIAARGQLAADAAVNRAYLQTDRSAAERDFALAIQLDPLLGHWHRGVARQDLWDDLAGAVEDFAAAVKLGPQDDFYYESLGEAQLLAGQDAAARETYRDLVSRLDRTARQGLIERLEALALEQPDVAAGVTVILAELRGAALP